MHDDAPPSAKTTETPATRGARTAIRWLQSIPRTRLVDGRHVVAESDFVRVRDYLVRRLEARLAASEEETSPDVTR